MKRLLLIAVTALAACAPPAGEGEESAAPAVKRQGLATAFATGSLIIPMDTTSQDNGILRAFGLVHRLLQSNIPVNRIALTPKTLNQVDFSVTATQREGGANLGTVNYSGGPFVIDSTNATAALVIVDAYLALDPVTNVHVATAGFTADVQRTLVAAPRIAVFEDGYQAVAYGYLNAANIRDSAGNAWTNASPGAMTIAEVAGATAGNDGALMNADGTPAFDQLTSMHYDAPVNSEAVREVRRWLAVGPITHAFMQCEAINAFENNVNGRFLSTLGLVDDGATANPINVRAPSSLFAQLSGSFTADTGMVDSIGLAPLSALHANSSVLIDRAGSPFLTRMVWLTGFLDGVPTNGKVSYLAGHDYSVALPISTNAATNGVRLFLDGLYETPGLTSATQPQLAITKSALTDTNATNFTFTINYANTGTAPAYNVVVTDVLPAGTTFVSQTGGGVNAAGTVTWTLGNVAAGAAGVLTVTVTAAEGTYLNTATSTYRVGLTNKSLTSNTTTTRVDRTAPVAPVVTAPANGSSTNDTTPTYTGTAEAGSSVTVSVDGAAVCTVIAVGGAFTCTPVTALAVGSHTVNATTTDAASNVSPVSTTNTFTVDVTPPAAPIVTAPANGSSTNDTTPTYSGTAEAGSSVTVSVDGAAVCTVTAVGGNWSCTPVTVLTATSHTVNAIATDVAGNPSPVSTTNTFTVDLTAPAAPVVTAPANGSRTNDTTPTYSGTAEAGSSVTVSVDGAAVCTVIAVGGAWTCTPVAAITATNHTVNASATDPAGNPSPVSLTNTFTVDVTPPAAPVVSAPANGSRTNDTTPTYSGTAEAGSSVTVSVDGAAVCTVTATGGVWTCTPVAALTAASHTVNAIATDVAGNPSAVSLTNTFTIDVTPPAAPVVTAPANGSSTNDTTPTYSGTAEAGSSVTVSVDGAAVCTVVATGGVWTCTPAPALSASSHTVNAIATDVAGNPSPVSATNTFSVDLTAPSAPVVSFPANGSFTGATPAYTGTAEAGSTVSVSVDGAVVCTAIATAGGSFSCTQPTALAAGPHTVNAIARDAATNASPVSNTNTFTVDTTAPAAPVVTSPANASTSNTSTPTYSGTAEANSSVAVVVDGTLACIATASATGAWSCVQPTALTDGGHTVNAAARDAANNLSAPSATNTFTIDTGLPAAPVVSTPANSASISNSFPTYSGTAEVGTTVTVRVDGTIACTSVTSAAGTFSCAQPTALPEGVHAVNATAADASSNVSPVSNTNSFTIDLTAPAAPVVTAPANGSSTGNNLPTYTGTAEPGSTVTVTVDGGVACTATAGATGAWSCVQPTALGDGPHTVVATAKDPATNTSGPSATIAFGVDTAAPDTSIVSGPSAQDPSPSATFDFSSTEAGVTFECSLDGAAFTACSDPATFTMLTAGMHTLQVRAKDAAGNVDATPAQQTWEVLSQLDTTIVSGPPALTKVATAAFDFSSNTANVTYECSIDGAAFAACTDPASFTGLPDGPHTLRVRAKDAANNIDTTPALHAWTLDTVAPPAPVITSPTNTSTVGITPPTVTGTGEPGATITIIIDGVPAGTVVVGPGGTWTFTPPTPLPDGMHTVTATATDPAGNTGPSSTTTTFAIDSSVLDTAIVSGPSGLTNSKTALFDFSSNKAGVTYECSLDGAAFAACADPATFSNLAEGPHTLLVRAKDGMANTDASPASRVWTVDSMPPAAAVVTTPANNSTVGTATPVFAGTAEPGSTVTVVIDGAVAGTAVVDANGNWTFIPAAPLGAGPHTVAAHATDPANNVGPDSPVNNFTVDTTLLDTFIVSGPMAVSRFASAAFDLASNRTNVTYECAIDGGAFMACTDPVTFMGLSEGNHTVLVRAKDGATVDATPASFTWKVDTVAPAAPVVATPANGATLTDNRPTVTGTAEPGATVVVSLDGQPIGTVIADASGNWSLPIPSALTDGTHTVSAVATDAAGNKGPPSATNTFTVSTGGGTLTAPTITTPVNATLTNDSTPTIAGKAPPNSTVSVFVDGVLAGTTIADANGNWTFTLPVQPDGAHTITAQAGQGTVKSVLSAPTSITIDATPPDVQILVSPPATNVEGTARFEFGSNDPAATYECSLDGGPFEPCTQEHTRQALALGEHTLTVRAVDAAGNQSTPKSATWIQAEATRPLQQLVGGGCGCSSVDPTALFALLGMLGFAIRRRRR